MRAGDGELDTAVWTDGHAANGDLLQSSGTFQPAVIEDIQAKAASGHQSMQLFGVAGK